MDNNQISWLAEGLQRQRMEQEEAKRRLMQEQMFRLQEEERQMIYRQDMAWHDSPRLQKYIELTKLQVQQKRTQEELLIHTKMETMQLVRTQFRAPNETDKDVS